MSPPRAGAGLACVPFSPSSSQACTWLHAEPPGPLAGGPPARHGAGWSQTLAAKGTEAAGTWAWEMLLGTVGRGPEPNRVVPPPRARVGLDPQPGAGPGAGPLTAAGARAGQCLQ